MLYFSSQPVAMDTVDPVQIAAVRNFKESCQKRGLYEGYDSYTEFQTKFYRHLQLKLNDHPLFKVVTPATQAGEFQRDDTRTLGVRATGLDINENVKRLAKNFMIKSLHFEITEDDPTTTRITIVAANELEIPRFAQALAQSGLEVLSIWR